MVAGHAPVALHRATRKKKEEVWSRGAGEREVEQLQRTPERHGEVPVATELYRSIRMLSCQPYLSSGRRACFPEQEVQRAGGTEAPSSRPPPPPFPFIGSISQGEAWSRKQPSPTALPEMRSSAMAEKKDPGSSEAKQGRSSGGKESGFSSGG
ncbi:UNVERIFIED_CONTAM: hypothetical protein K2H54_056973 [Gekko kuhli]